MSFRSESKASSTGGGTAPGRRALDTHAVTDHDEGHFSGSPTAVPFSSSVVASLARDGRLDQPAVDGLLHGEGGSSPPVSRPHRRSGGHPVLGEGTRLIRADHRTRPPGSPTALSSFMMAFSLAIFWVPMAWTMVTMELRASGMAATARATANIRGVQNGLGAEASRMVQGQGEHPHADDEG